MALDENPEPLEPLVQAAKQGDKGALGQLLRRLWPWLRRKARYYVAWSDSPVGVSTLTQETALRLSRSIRGIRAKSSPAVKALLTRIMANTATSSHRFATRRKRDPDGTAPEDFLPQSEEPSDQQLEKVELEQRVLAAIERLPERQRQAVNLLRAGASYQEIAAQLGCSLAAARMLLKRAEAELTEVLRELDSSSS